MGLKFIPKIVYGAGPTTLTLTYPQKLWTPGSRPHGGGNVSDAGIPESFIIRRDQLVKIEVRFTEAEWTSIDAWLDWGQRANSFDYWFDKDDGATARTYYLDSPTLGNGEVMPTRDTSNRHVFSIPVTLRATNGVIINALT